MRSVCTLLIAVMQVVVAAESHFASARRILQLNIPYGRAKNKDGARTFQNATGLRLRHYAERVGASLHVIRSTSEVPVPGVVADAWAQTAPGRGNSTIYVLKLLAVSQALERHERVLLVDDTVFVTPNASDIFAACPTEAAVCAFSEGTSPVPEMRMTYARSKFSLRAKGVTAEPARYFNTGVVVWGQGARKLLSAAQIAEGMTYFGTGHPSQDYLCARLVQDPSIPTHRLHRAYNFMPGRNLLKSRILEDGGSSWTLRVGMLPSYAVHMYHLTSGVPGRAGVIAQLDRQYPRPPEPHAPSVARAGLTWAEGEAADAPGAPRREAAGSWGPYGVLHAAYTVLASDLALQDGMRAAILLRKVMEPSYPLALVANQHAYGILQQKKTLFLWDIVRNAGNHAEVRAQHCLRPSWSRAPCAAIRPSTPARHAAPPRATAPRPPPRLAEHSQQPDRRWSANDRRGSLPTSCASRAHSTRTTSSRAATFSGKAAMGAPGGAGR